MRNSLTDFVQEHIDDDISRLVLDRGKWPDIDIQAAVNNIESRRKLKGKVQEWFDEPLLYFPAKLSAEQCSSSATGKYKAGLATRIIRSTTGKENFTVADLTGGLGVDSWFFSRTAEKVMYCEMQESLCMAATHNFKILGAGNIEVRNMIAAPGKDLSEMLSKLQPDMVYIDPARRGEGGRKVFMIEDCTPDVLQLKDIIFKEVRHILLKLSPMADISLVCERFSGRCRQVHAVESKGECKELLVWIDRDWEGEYSVCAADADIAYTDPSYRPFTFTPSQERDAIPRIAQKKDIDTADYLFEPGKALMKAGAFNLISSIHGLEKLGRSTHYYLYSITGRDVPEHEVQRTLETLMRIGRTYRIIGQTSLDKRGIRSFGTAFPKSEVTARNIPMDSAALKKKLGVTSGDDAHIFGLKSDTTGNLLFAVRPYRPGSTDGEPA